MAMRERKPEHEHEPAGSSVAEQSRQIFVHWSSGINFAAGIWLVVAPFALGYSGTANALYNDVGIGMLVAVLAALRIVSPLQNVRFSWTNVVLGAWLIAAPFVLGYGTLPSAVANDLILGIIIIVAGLSSAISSKPAAG